jgi:aminomuconate-semialdehyde/2-hydroxymuconate-6-semialdehyde dehydrogenase
MNPADIRTTLNYIDGDFVTAASGKSYENRSPVDGSLIRMVSEAGQVEADAAVAAALAGPWGKMPLQKRPQILHAVAAEINRRFDEFLEAEVADTGKAECIHSSSIPNLATSV